MQEIKDRIIHLMKTKNLNATQLAEALNIQRSGISHILSGRNKPGTDFIIKLKESYPEFSLDWLLLGKGPATISPPNQQKAEVSASSGALQPSLFDFAEDNTKQDGKAPMKAQPDMATPPEFGALKDSKTDGGIIPESTLKENPPVDKGDTKKLVKLILVYNDNTFSALSPSD